MTFFSILALVGGALVLLGLLLRKNAPIMTIGAILIPAPFVWGITTDFIKLGWWPLVLLLWGIYVGLAVWLLVSMLRSR